MVRRMSLTSETLMEEAAEAARVAAEAEAKRKAFASVAAEQTMELVLQDSQSSPTLREAGRETTTLASVSSPYGHVALKSFHPVEAEENLDHVETEMPAENNSTAVEAALLSEEDFDFVDPVETELLPDAQRDD